MAMLDHVLLGDEDLRAFYAERPEQARAIANRVRCQLPWLLAAMAGAEAGSKRGAVEER